MQSNAQDAIYDAWRNNQPVPLAHTIDKTLTIESAYAIQSYVVRRQWGKTSPGGFKGGLTSQAAQARFNTHSPVAGVLPKKGLLNPGATLYLSELRGLHLETEVAFRIGKRVNAHIESIAQLKEHIDGIAPAIELPTLNFETPEQLNALDLIAANVSAAAYVVGDFASPSQRDPNSAAPILICNNNEVNKGNARDALGDQWQAALWLVNRTIDSGWTLEPGQILLTGALGSMLPAVVGSCIASFGDWGTLGVDIQSQH